MHQAIAGIIFALALTPLAYSKQHRSNAARHTFVRNQEFV